MEAKQYKQTIHSCEDTGDYVVFMENEQNYLPTNKKTTSKAKFVKKWSAILNVCDTIEAPEGDLNFSEDEVVEEDEEEEEELDEEELEFKEYYKKFTDLKVEGEDALSKCLWSYHDYIVSCRIESENYDDIEDLKNDYNELINGIAYLQQLKENQKKVRAKKEVPKKTYTFSDGKLDLSAKAVKHLDKKGVKEKHYKKKWEVAEVLDELKDFNEKKATKSGGNKKKNLSAMDTHKLEFIPCLYYWKDAVDISGAKYWKEDEGIFKEAKSKSSYRPSWKEVIKYRTNCSCPSNKKECRECKCDNKAKTWNSATSHIGNNTHKCCVRLKAFKEAKVCVYMKRDPKKVFNCATLADLIKKHKLDKKDLVMKEAK